MKQLIYDELVSWYRLLDPVDDHADEAACYDEAFARAIVDVRGTPTLLELGCGAGNNAWHLAPRFDCTLSDISEPMLALSAELNDCEHLLGDMRSLRLERTFDAVLVHDAVCYMTSEADLRAAAETAFAHTRPGGAAIFTPDATRESFCESTLLHQGTDEAAGRALRCVEWTWDPDPSDTTYQVEFAFLLREGDAVRAVHDRHRLGLFSRETWRAVLLGAGYDAIEHIPRPIGDGEHDEIFLCRRNPASR